MKYSLLLLLFCSAASIAQTQNVGIGITNPTANLMINTNSGFANPQLLMRQTNPSDWARMRVQTGTVRYWDIAGFNGTVAPNDRLNFYHSTAGDILTLSGNGFVGINNNNPLAPLSFPPSIGRKIILYPGATGNVGVGVYNNELRIHTDYEPADITLGYENLAGVFTEKFRFKGNGAITLGGNGGSYGQLLASGGSGSAFWRPVSSIISQAIMPEVTYTIPANIPIDIPGATFTLNAPSSGKLIIWVNTTSTLVCANPLDACTWAWQLKTFLNNSEMNTWFIQPQTQVTQPDYSQSVGPIVLNVPAGNHTIKFREVLISIIAPPTIRVSAYAQFIAD